jgi:hypothetical protein
MNKNTTQNNDKEGIHGSDELFSPIGSPAGVHGGVGDPT